MNDNNNIDTDMNKTFQNGYMGTRFGLLNSHTIPQSNESSKVNEKNTIVENGVVNGHYFYINSFTGSVIKNRNYIS